MSKNIRQFQNILYVAEPLQTFDTVLTKVVELAAAQSAKLTIAVIAPDVRGAPLESHPDFQRLMAALEPYQQYDIQVEILNSISFIEIIRSVLSKNHDLLIKAAENPSFIQRLFSSNDMHLLRKCPCPVWLVKTEGTSTCKTIVAAVDFDIEISNSVTQQLNQSILELAATLALLERAEIHFVHAWEAPGELSLRAWSNNPEAAAQSYAAAESRLHQQKMNDFERQFDATMASHQEELTTHYHLCKGAAAWVIPEQTRKLQADLLVMGTISRTGIPGLFIGNTAETILEQLDCSVLTTKPPGFISPVSLQA